MVDCGLLWSGCVCCNFTVAFGNAGLPGAFSGGSVIRAVSFFGVAAFCVTGSGTGVAPGAGPAPPAAGGAGFSGTVGREPSAGGFGGGLMPLNGLTGGPPSGTPGADFGAGGGGEKALVAGGAADSGAEPPTGSLVVSFFGVTPIGGTV